MNDRIKIRYGGGFGRGGSGRLDLGCDRFCVLCCVIKSPKKNRKFCDDQCIKTLNYRANLYSVDYYSNTVAIFHQLNDDFIDN